MLTSTVACLSEEETRGRGEVMVGEGQFKGKEWGWRCGVGEGGLKGGSHSFLFFSSKSAFYFIPESTVTTLHKITKLGGDKLATFIYLLRNVHQANVPHLFICIFVCLLLVYLLFINLITSGNCIAIFSFSVRIYCIVTDLSVYSIRTSSGLFILCIYLFLLHIKVRIILILKLVPFYLFKTALTFYAYHHRYGIIYC